MSPPRARARPLGAPSLLLLALAGCGQPAATPLADWELSAPGLEPRPIHLPRHFDRVLPQHELEYTLRTTVTLPPALEGRDLELDLPYFAGRVTLTADGAPAASLDEDPVRGYRARGPHRFRIARPQASPLTLELRVEHRHTRSAWLDTLPRLVPAGARDRATLLVRLVDDLGALIALAVLFQLGLLYLALSAIDAQRRAWAWLGLQLLGSCALPLFMLGVSQPLGPVEGSLVASLLCLALLCSVPHTHALFQLGRPHPIWWLLGAVAVVLSFAFHGPFRVVRVAGPVTVLALGMVALYQLIVLAQALRRSQTQDGAPGGAGWALLSWLALVAAAVPDGVSWLGRGELLGGGKTASLGLVAFAVGQALVYRRRHQAQLQRAERLSAELAAHVERLELENRELTALVDELRQQVAERTTRFQRTDVAPPETRPTGDEEPTRPVEPTLDQVAAELEDPGPALPVLLELAAALAALHDAGQLHGALDPMHVRIAGSGPSTRVQLIGPKDPARRSPDAARYRAPEQARGSVGPPGDVFSFGVLAFELLTNCFPYSTPFALLTPAEAAAQTALPIASLCEELDREAAALIDACLRLDPERRPTARAVAEGLARCVDQRSTAAG